jgi:protein-S-isoprenylcysteine O-methyltransferase Ste14
MTISWQVAVFGLASILLVWVSWQPLHNPRSHGFPRFFAWEAITALTVWNLDRWFYDPLSPPQVASWLLLMGALFPVLYGLWLMKRVGQPNTTERPVAQASNYTFENTTKLVEVGIYRYIRHPLYSSLLLLAWGVFFKKISLAGGVLALFATACLFATAILEEHEDIQSFGPEYAAYMKRTRRFIPFLI